MPIYKPPSKQIQEEKETNEPHQRLTITHLVLNDFKSYAGRQIIGPFHCSFSAVVGPNGSGKSNVIDSLLFVFGFRASKMRQSKVSSLIHNSTSHPSLSSCGVEVHFEDVIDNLDGTTTVVPDSKLVVSRKAYKNNSSKYYINDKDSNFTEVTALLKGRGIDLDHKRFLILQGEVESIAQMKAKADNEHDDGLLEYLEDIIGTADYKRIIDEAQEEVEQLNESCLEKTTRLEIVEKEKTGLSGRRNDIVKHLKLENQLVLKRSALYQLNMSNNQNKIKVGEKMAIKLNEQLEQEEQKNKGIQEEIKGLEFQHSNGIEEINEVKGKHKETTKLLSIKERELVQLAERKKHLSSKRKKLEKTISNAQHSKREAENWLSNYNEETSRQKEKLQLLESSLKTEEAELEKIRGVLRLKTQGFTDEIAKNQKLLNPWNTKIDQKRSEVAIAQSQVDILKEKDVNAQQTLVDGKRAIEKVIALGRKREEEFQRLEKEYFHVCSQINLGGEECDHASKMLKEMKDELSIIRQRASQAKESINAFKSQGKILSGLTRLRDSGRITGFHGRLGNLGTIDNRYDVAISTACPRLDNIVVDTVEVGQQCIEHLKKNNLGRGFFILLNKLPRNLNWDRIETPENVPRLFDLIKLKDPIFAPAFYSVLNDTLVAKDLTQANRIAYGKKRWRVVTLDGQLIDKSGTMTGGGNQVARGGMKSKLTAEISDEAFSKLEEEREEQENKFSIASKTLQEMQAAMKTLQNRKPQIELEVSKIKLEIESLSQSLLDAESQYQEQVAEFEAKKTTGDKEDLERALTQVKLLNVEIDELKAQTAGIQKVITDLQENILEAGGIKMRVQKSKVDGILQQIEIITNKLDDDSMSHSKSSSELKKYTKILAEAEAELSESAEENQAVEEEFTQRTLDVRKLEQEAEEVNNILIDKEEAILTIKTDLDEKLAAVNEARSVEIELRNQLQENTKAIHDNTYNYDKWKNRYLALSLHDINLMCGKEREDGEEIPTLPEFSEDEISTFNREDLKRGIVSLEKGTENANIDVSILTEYARREKEFETRRLGLNEAVELRDQTKLKVDTLKRRRLEEFMVGFNKITMKLKEMYQMITMGGNAELELVDSLDPFAEGILFSVMPPKKSWRNIANLSGGEKTLSSLALVFALHHYKPTPLYVMDEIDAALDFRNVSIIASYIKERTKNAQFIVISLRNNMFELSRQLVGIYKVNNMTKSITLQNKDLVHDTKPVIKLEKKSDKQSGKLSQITEEITDNNRNGAVKISKDRRISLTDVELTADGVHTNVSRIVL
ncbi:RecF/RecN/SMC protein [Nadsonia fulvescens var. elongata DSM 6958]|uniref:Structural maintenance of chromosomes protein n=1 Tax=Nadsonia fulvescens var. elongata DSM 6958 TaxID=857566 RepID=A0A1E3PJ65_9ASCO|nr:RecF/RecN/SMC protein [Nadsonia fulvescens var. elongata DSM 6958]